MSIFNNNLFEIYALSRDGGKFVKMIKFHKRIINENLMGDKLGLISMRVDILSFLFN